MKLTSVFLTSLHHLSLKKLKITAVTDTQSAVK